MIELHDCFSANELISYEALGLTPEGTGERFITAAGASRPARPHDIDAGQIE